MPTVEENVCCLEIPKVIRRLHQLPEPPSCMVNHPGLKPVCLNVFSLQNVFNLYRADYGPIRLRGIEHRYRYLAYRSFVSWCWGFLGRRVRVVLPACVVLRTWQEFPDEEGRYVGFRPALNWTARRSLWWLPACQVGQIRHRGPGGQVFAASLQCMGQGPGKPPQRWGPSLYPRKLQFKKWK